MLPYCTLFYDFNSQSYLLQNPNPFMTWNYGNNFQKIHSNQYQLFNINQPKHQTKYPKIHFPTPNLQIIKNQQEQNIILPLQAVLNNHFIPNSSQSNSKHLQKINKDSNITKTKIKQIKRRGRSEKKDKAYVAKQYPKQQPSLKCRYIQKNFELNVINQVFSFLWSEEKSNKFVRRYLKNELKTTLFYEYMKIVKKFCKRYINKEYLKNLCDYQSHHIAYKMVTKNPQKLSYLSMKQFSECIRHLIYTYLYQLCPQAILTSKKMRRQIWGEHLIKCRLLRNFIFNKITAQQYERDLINGQDSNKSNESTEQN